MMLSLIVCTYQRAEALNRLLASVVIQTTYPDEILIIDGSKDLETQQSISSQTIRNLKYFKVEEKDRGLTRQRNFGTEKLNSKSEIVCFLDDDVVLEPDYFKAVLKAFDSDPDIVGVGGVATHPIGIILQKRFMYLKALKEMNLNAFTYVINWAFSLRNFPE